MKGIIAVLALLLILQTSFILSRTAGSTQEPTGSQPQTEYKALTTEVERLSTDVAELKARVSALEKVPALQPPAPIPVPHCVVNRERVNVREGPGVVFAVIGTVSRGEGFDVKARNVAGDWYRFCCVEGRSGWINAPLLICTDDDEIPVAKDIPNPPIHTPPLDWPRIAPENSCSPYDQNDYSYPQSVEPQIVREMGGRIYSPYTGRYFASTSETDIEHIVARSEAHESGMCAASSSTKRAFARDLLNLTLASPSVNQHQKGAKDVAEWLPDMNVCWYVQRVVDVKRKYDLTMDSAESQRARAILSNCTNTEIWFADSSAPSTSGENNAQDCRRNPLECYDDNRNGRITCAEARAHGIAPVPRGHPAYRYMNDRDGDGVVCE